MSRLVAMTLFYASIVLIGAIVLEVL